MQLEKGEPEDIGGRPKAQKKDKRREIEEANIFSK